MNWVFSGMGLAAIIAAVALFGMKLFAYEKGDLKKPLMTSLKIAGVGLILLVFGLSYFQVEEGEKAVLKRFGAVVGETLDAGPHFKIPVADKVIRYRTIQLVYETSDNPDTSQADYRDFSVDTMTEDGQRIKVRFTVVFHIDGAQIEEIVRNIGTEQEVVEKIVKSNARSEGRNVPKKFLASDLYGENIYKAQEALFKQLEPIYLANGVILDEVLLRDIGFDENLAQALEAKQIALENQVTAQRQIAVKEAEAQQLIAAAKGQAESDIVKAEAQAKAISLIQAELGKSPQYNEYILAKGIADGTTGIEWGFLPSEMMPLVNIPSKQPTE